LRLRAASAPLPHKLLTLRASKLSRTQKALQVTAAPSFAVARDFLIVWTVARRAGEIPPDVARRTSGLAVALPRRVVLARLPQEPDRRALPPRQRAARRSLRQREGRKSRAGAAVRRGRRPGSAGPLGDGAPGRALVRHRRPPRRTRAQRR